MRFVAIIGCLLILKNIHAQTIFIDAAMPLQSQLTKDSATYVITSSIDLNNDVVSIPSCCTIVINGGNLKNGTLKGNNTMVENLTVENVVFDGTFTNNSLILDKSHFGGSVDLLGILYSFPNATVSLRMDIEVCGKRSRPVRQIKIDGNGFTLKLNKFPLSRNIEVCLNNIVFDCSQAEDDFLYTISDGNGSFMLKNCVFNKIGECNLITSRGYHETTIIGNMFEGTLASSSVRKRSKSRVILVYDAKGKVVVSKNVIRKCYGIGIDAIGFDSNMRSGVFITNNAIDSISNGAIVINGGDVWNARIDSNKISNTHCLGSIIGESTGAENSAINVHGFHSLSVSNNTISNCIMGSSIEINGKSGSAGIAQGSELRICSNNCHNVNRIALYGVVDALFEDNILVSMKGREKSLYFLSVLGSKNVIVRKNKIKTFLPSQGSVYPIYLSNTKDLISGDIIIERNLIESEGKAYLYFNKTFTGLCRLNQNTNVSLRDNGSLILVNSTGKDNLILQDIDDIIKKH